MKKIVFYLILTSINISPILIYTAADDPLSSSPRGTGWSDMFLGTINAAVGWIEKKTGTKPIGYCIDKTAQQLLKNTEQKLELALADNRMNGKTKTYLQVMSDLSFQQWGKQLNDRAYFDWEHTKNAIAEDRFKDIEKLWKINRINLSPCIRTAIQLYLEQNKSRRTAAPNPKDTIARFDLSRTNTKPGYIEATIPTIEQETASFPDLSKTIRDYASSLAIASPIQSAERRARKTFDPSFSISYLQEIEKAQKIYAVFFAHLFATKAVGDSISELFRKEDFLSVYNQVWDRDTHLRYVLSEQLRRGSLDACSIYVHHKQNIAPLFAVLISDMILSHEQHEYARSVSPTFQGIFLHEKKPYGKYVFMFLNSLNKDQKIKLYNLRESIAHLDPPKQSAAIHTAVRADKAQLELLAEIQGGEHLPQLLEAIRLARVNAPVIFPSSSSSSSSSSFPTDYNPENVYELPLQIDLPETAPEE